MARTSLPGRCERCHAKLEWRYINWDEVVLTCENEKVPAPSVAAAREVSDEPLACASQCTFPVEEYDLEEFCMRADDPRVGRQREAAASYEVAGPSRPTTTDPSLQSIQDFLLLPTPAASPALCGLSGAMHLPSGGQSLPASGWLQAAIDPQCPAAFDLQYGTRDAQASLLVDGGGVAGAAAGET